MDVCRRKMVVEIKSLKKEIGTKVKEQPARKIIEWRFNSKKNKMQKKKRIGEKMNDKDGYYVSFTLFSLVYCSSAHNTF